MITTIVVDTPRTSYVIPSPVMHTIDSMRVFASPLLHKLLVAFDGIQVTTRNTPKCAKPVNMHTTHTEPKSRSFLIKEISQPQSSCLKRAPVLPASFCRRSHA